MISLESISHQLQGCKPVHCEYKNGSEANELLYNGKGDKCKGVTLFYFGKWIDIIPDKNVSNCWFSLKTAVMSLLWSW